VVCNDPNGIGDIDHMRLSLTGNMSDESYHVTWDGTSWITNTTYFTLDQVNSTVQTSGTNDQWITFLIEITLDWDFPLTDGTLIHEDPIGLRPHVTIRDLTSPEQTASIGTHRWYLENDLAVQPGGLQATEGSSGRTLVDGDVVASGVDVHFTGVVGFVDLPQVYVTSADADVQVSTNGSSGTDDDGSLGSNGTFETTIPAPAITGTWTYTFEVVNISGLGADGTDPTTTFTLRTDGTPPSVTGLVSPVGTIPAANTSHLWVAADLYEDIEIGTSIDLNWLLELTQVSIGTGSTAATIVGTNGTITLVTVADLTEGGVLDLDRPGVTVTFWYDGADRAGNPLTGKGSSVSDPFDPLPIGPSTPIFSIDHSATTVSAVNISEGEQLTVQITILNTGIVSGNATVVLWDEVDVFRGELDNRTIFIEAHGANSYEVTWKVSVQGEHNLTVQVYDLNGHGGDIFILDLVTVGPPEESEDLGSELMMLGMGMLALIIVILLIMFLRRGRRVASVVDAVYDDITEEYTDEGTRVGSDHWSGYGQPEMQSPFQSGYDEGFGPGYEAGYQPGYDPNYEYQ
jgi:hypothetical protein